MIPLSSVSPSVTDASGGQLLTIVGTFAVGNVYRVFLGPLGTSADGPCYSGVQGQALDVRSADGVTIECVAAPSTKGARFLTVTSPGDSGNLAVTIVERCWRDKVYRMRRSLPPWMDCGARRLALEGSQ